LHKARTSCRAFFVFKIKFLKKKKEKKKNAPAQRRKNSSAAVSRFLNQFQFIKISFSKCEAPDLDATWRWPFVREEFYLVEQVIQIFLFDLKNKID
jgi:hypothetical protein